MFFSNLKSDCSSTLKIVYYSLCDPRRHACGRHTQPYLTPYPTQPYLTPYPTQPYLTPYCTLHIPDTTVAAHEVCVTFGVVGFMIHEGVRVEGVGARKVLLTLLTVISSFKSLVVRHSYNTNVRLT